jgi:alkylation response protein AidB-like acyl-CoA dehydrogenase
MTTAAATTGSLLYSDIEESLRSSVRELLADRAPAASVLARIESGEPYDRALWQALARDLGVAGLVVSEADGGHGASWREAAVVAEELGRSCAATPFLGSAVLATAAARAAGDAQLLTGLASGTTVATLAMPIAGSPHTEGIELRDGSVHGSVQGVIDALDADVLLVVAGDALVEVAAADVTRTAVVSLDMTRPLADLDFAGAPGRVIATGADAGRAVKAGWAAGAVLLSAEQLGLAERCLDIAVAYLKSRYQFGRPIGSFQALKHRAAELWAAIAQARAVVRYATGCLADADADLPVAVSLAQAYCSPLAVHAAEECVQLHGGIGFTWEHPAHLYLKRAKADSLLLGTAAVHRARLGGLVDLPAN